MNELTCNYAPIRFQPYRETGEFVNIGVVVYCPKTDYLDFRLQLKRRQRVTNFFPELDANLLRSALAEVQKGLERCKNTGDLLTNGATHGEEQISRGKVVFKELIRTREAIVHFGQPGTILAESPKKALADLYARFVERQFAQTREYQEIRMRDRLAVWLRKWHVKTLYRSDCRVGDAEFHVRLPFVHYEGERASKALKPLFLAQDETTAIYDHGGLWLQRIRRLRTRNSLPTQTVFAVTMPVSMRNVAAAKEIWTELEKEDVAVVNFQDGDRLKELAAIKPSNP